MKTLRRGLIAAAVVLLAGVAVIALVAMWTYEPGRQYRGLSTTGPSVMVIPAGASLAASGQLDLSRASIFKCGSPGSQPGPYSIAFVEFDDQGFLWDPRQMRALEQHIDSLGAGRGVIIVAFVHGWNHTGAVTDNNVACFQQVIQAVSLLENKVNGAHARAVVGVYCGWRGAVFRVVAVNRLLSFWDRLAAADRLGERGDLLRVLTTLSHLKNTSRGQHPSILALTGHSMGARALFLAVGPNLKESLARAALGEDMLGGFGDLVVLVNPAFSAADYKFIDGIVSDPEVQRLSPPQPALVLLSSPADLISRRLYPLGEYVRSGRQSIQPKIDRAMLVQTAANYPPFVTHRLRVVEGRVPDPTDRGAESPCGCRFVCADELPIVRGVLAHPERRELFRYSDIRVFSPENPDQIIYRLVLEGVRTGRQPAVVIQADGPIMPSHGETFTPALIEFLVRLVNAKVESVSRDRETPRASTIPPP